MSDIIPVACFPELREMSVLIDDGWFLVSLDTTHWGRDTAVSCGLFRPYNKSASIEPFLLLDGSESEHWDWSPVNEESSLVIESLFKVFLLASLTSGVCSSMSLLAASWLDKGDTWGLPTRLMLVQDRGLVSSDRFCSALDSGGSSESCKESEEYSSFCLFADTGVSWSESWELSVMALSDCLHVFKSLFKSSLCINISSWKSSSLQKQSQCFGLLYNK